MTILPSNSPCLDSNTWAEIDLDALAHNVSLLNTIGVELMAVLKADAYGHGTDIIAPALMELGVRHLGVATVCEGIELQQSSEQVAPKIYVMTAITPGECSAVVEYNLIPFVSSIECLQTLQSAARKQRKTVDVHLEVDTGIGRAGLQTQHFLEVLRNSLRMDHIAVTGICTQFTSGEDREDAEAQYAVFESLLNEIPSDVLSTLSIHAANSPAALNVPAARYSMIRPGLLLYGIAPTSRGLPETWQKFPFRPVLSLHSRVILLRDVPRGTSISYGRTFTTKAPTRIATIGIGYGDGYPRRLSNLGHVLLPRGIAVPIRGRVCMDQICVEVPPSSSLVVGDMVTLIGKSGDAQILAVELAELIDATPHEITTCLTERVRRVTRESSIA